MLNSLFPMSFPEIKMVKQKSENSIMNFGDAFMKEFMRRKYNTYLKIENKSCTVDGVTLLDTFNTNPVYKKLYELSNDYLNKRDIALDILTDDVSAQNKAVLKELNGAGSTSANSSGKLTDVINSIVQEIEKIKNDIKKITGKFLKKRKL